MANITPRRRRGAAYICGQCGDGFALGRLALAGRAFLCSRDVSHGISLCLREPLNTTPPFCEAL